MRATKSKSSRNKLYKVGKDQCANLHYRRYEEYIVAECVGNVTDNWRKILAKLFYLWNL